MFAALAVATLLAQSDPSEWATPPQVAPRGAADAGTQAGVEAVEPEWSPPPGSRLEDPPEPVAAPKPRAPEKVIEQPAPDPRRWSWGHFALALTGAFGQSGYFAVRVEAGGVVGLSRRITGTANRAMGPTLGLAFDLLAAKIRIGACGSAGICGSRYQAGLGLRGAWSWGVIDKDGIVAPIHSVFVQAVAFASSNSVPSAPLFPGSTWGEHGVRFDVGLTTGILRGSLWPRPGGFVIGGGLYFAASLEWLIVNTEQTGRFRAGLSLGVGI